jgi:tripartite-type tricarboxylate transporter receptor subunit TctC
MIIPFISPQDIVSKDTSTINRARNSHMPVLRRRINALATHVAVALTLCTAPACADPSVQAWPQRPVRVIVPTGAGSGIDITARLFAERLTARWKQPVIVENRPGADGLIGTAAFINMHDDHVLLFGPAAPISVYPSIHQKLGYDPQHDLAPIALAAETFPVIAATASLNVSSLQELVALAHSKPGTLNYRPSPGAFPTLFAGFLHDRDLNMVEINYRDDSLSYEDLGAGRIQLAIGTLTGVLPQVHANKATALAVTNKSRCPLIPNVQTAAEAGYPELTFEGLIGFFGPGNMSLERRERIAVDVHAAAVEVATRLAAIGQVARGSTPAEFIAAIDEQRAKIVSIVNVIGSKPTR